MNNKKDYEKQRDFYKRRAEKFFLKAKKAEDSAEYFDTQVQNCLWLEEYEKNKKEENTMESCSCEKLPVSSDWYNKPNLNTTSVSAPTAICQQTTSIPTDQKQRDYLLQRLADVRSDKHLDLKRTFGLSDDESPKTFDEFIERIKAGKFVKGEFADELFLPWSPTSNIRWRDPALKADMAGFDKANDQLNKNFQIAKDKINILSPEDGLKALEEFEANNYEYK